MATHFFWDPLSDNILQERDDTGAVTASYTTEPGEFGNVISQHRGGVNSQYHYDGLGSTLALTDDNQNVTDTYAYNAFGEVTEQTGTTVNPFQYMGQRGYYKDDVTGECFVRRRMLSTKSGRWLSADPLGLIDGPCVYMYSKNRVTVLHDPSGFASCCHCHCTDISIFKRGIGIYYYGAGTKSGWFSSYDAIVFGYGFVVKVKSAGDRSCLLRITVDGKMIEWRDIVGKSTLYAPYRRREFYDSFIEYAYFPTTRLEYNNARSQYHPAECAGEMCLADHPGMIMWERYGLGLFGNATPKSSYCVSIDLVFNIMCGDWFFGTQQVRMLQVREYACLTLDSKGKISSVVINGIANDRVSAFESSGPDLLDEAGCDF